MNPEQSPMDWKPPPSCPKCDCPLQNGWCRECADRRRPKLLALLFVILPLIGFGTCCIGVLASFDNPPSSLASLSLVGPLIIAISVVIGIIHFIMTTKWFRDRDG